MRVSTLPVTYLAKASTLLNKTSAISCSLRAFRSAQTMSYCLGSGNTPAAIKRSIVGRTTSGVRYLFWRRVTRRFQLLMSWPLASLACSLPMKMRLGTPRAMAMISSWTSTWLLGSATWGFKELTLMP